MFLVQYDYLIVFPITEGEWRSPKIEKEDRSSWGFDRVRWKDVEDAWKNGVPGTEEDKDEAVANLATFWKKRCGLYPDADDELLKVTIPLHWSAWKPNIVAHIQAPHLSSRWRG